MPNDEKPFGGNDQMSETSEQRMDRIEKTLDRLTERQQALTESTQMLHDSHAELSSMVRAMVADTKEQRERDREHMRLLARVLDSWAGENGHA